MRIFSGRVNSFFFCYFQIKNKELTFLEPKDLHECHIIATQKCLNEYEKQTLNDADFNSDTKWMESEVRNIYSSYLILNQTNKDRNELTFKEKLNIIINPSDFLKERIQQNIIEQFKYAKSKYSFASPIELIKTTVFIGSLVFYLFVSYIMMFVSALAKVNIKFSFVLNSLCNGFQLLFILIANFCFEFTNWIFNLFKTAKSKPCWILMYCLI